MNGMNDQHPTIHKPVGLRHQTAGAADGDARRLDPPSKLPCETAKSSSARYVSREGTKTKTPELKQSGQPASGAADSSSRSNRSSMFCSTWGTARPSAAGNAHRDPLINSMNSEQCKRDVMKGHTSQRLNGIDCQGTFYNWYLDNSIKMSEIQVRCFFVHHVFSIAVKNWISTILFIKFVIQLFIKNL